MLYQSREKSIEFVKRQAFEIINSTKLYSYKGSVSKLLGLTVEVKLPGLKIGDLCFIETAEGEVSKFSIRSKIGENFFIIGLPNTIFDKSSPLSPSDPFIFTILKKY